MNALTLTVRPEFVEGQVFLTGSVHAVRTDSPQGSIDLS